MTDRVVLWDFDGTLAWRPGLWGGCVLEVLDELEPGSGVPIQALREGLRDGFPWHDARTPHPHLADSDAWWAPVIELISATVERAGVDNRQARRVAQAVRERFVDASVGWRVFDDTVPALVRLAEFGWSNVVLSNHVPELPDLVHGLGLTEHFAQVFTSARIGYEKPHPEAFRAALRECGTPGRVWMVGDNPIADVQGAEAVGLPAILVRRSGQAEHSAYGLADAVEMILAQRA